MFQQYMMLDLGKRNATLIALVMDCSQSMTQVTADTEESRLEPLEQQLMTVCCPPLMPFSISRGMTGEFWNTLWRY